MATFSLVSLTEIQTKVEWKDDRTGNEARS